MNVSEMNSQSICINPNDWDRIFKMPWLSVNEVKIRYFQFRFLTRILPTNRLVNLMGRKINHLSVHSVILKMRPWNI